MTKLIEKDDPLWFGQTCNKPYDRHHYQICFSNGSSKIVESWEEASGRKYEAPKKIGV